MVEDGYGSNIDCNIQQPKRNIIQDVYKRQPFEHDEKLPQTFDPRTGTLKQDLTVSEYEALVISHIAVSYTHLSVQLSKRKSIVFLLIILIVTLKGIPSLV